MSHRILVLDDNENFTAMLAIGLRMQGHIVLSVNDSPSALDLARDFKPDVIVADIAMPELDGFTFAKLVRADETLCKILLIAGTGYEDSQIIERCHEAGFDSHLRKPFSHKDIEKTLSKWRG